MRLGRVAWLTAKKPITVAGPRPIFTALPHFPNLQIENNSLRPAVGSVNDEEGMCRCKVRMSCLCKVEMSAFMGGRGPYGDGANRFE